MEAAAAAKIRPDRYRPVADLLLVGGGPVIRPGGHIPAADDCAHSTLQNLLPTAPLAIRQTPIPRSAPA